MSSPNSSDSTPLSLLRRRSRVSSLPNPNPNPNPTLGNGDLVWVKSFPYVWHPAKIRRCRRSKALLSFFSSSSPPRWIHQSRILPFEEGFGAMIGVSRGRVSEEVGLAMAEVGRRNVVGLGWGKGLGVFKREVGRIREGFEVGEVVRVVRERGVCVFGGGDGERCLAVRVAAQVLAFRRFSEDLRVGMVRCREVLGFVRSMGVGEGCGDGVGEMVEWVVAFRRFVSVIPVWVFREMAGLSGDLVDDEDEEEGSDVDSESSEESSSDEEKSLVGLSNVNQKIPEKPTATALEKNLDKEDEVISNEVSGFSTQSVASSVEYFASSADKCFTYKEYNSNYVEHILKLLCSTATKPSFAEAKQLETMNEYIVKWRKLAYQDTIFCSHNNTCNRKVQLSQRFSNLTSKKVISKTDVSQSFQLNMVIDGPITEAVPASHSHLSKTFDLDTPCTSKFTKNRLHESTCMLSTEELLVDESPLETVLEEKEGQCSATTVRGKDKVIDSYAVPINSSKESLDKVSSPTKTEFVSPFLGHRAVGIQDILKQLHFIAANSCCFRKKRHKLVYVHLLKFRELLYLNMSHLELLSCFCPSSGHQRRTRNKQVASEHKQPSHTNGDISISHEDDGVGRNKHVIGKPSSDSHKDNLCADDMSIFFRNLLRNSGCDQVSYSKSAFVLHVNNHITCDCEPTWTNRRSIVTREESLFVHKMLSHLYSLAVDIYHGGIWNVDLLYRILLQYRTLVLQNVQKITPRCILSKESEPPELANSDVETVEMDIEANSANAPSRDSETPLVHNVIAEISTHGMITSRTPLLSIVNEKNMTVSVDKNLHGDDGKLSPDFKNLSENNGVLNDNNVSVDGDITSYTNDTRMKTDLRNRPENIDVEMVETDIEADGSNGPKREMLAPVVLHISSEIPIHDKVKNEPPSLSIVNGKNIAIDRDRSLYADYENLSSDLRYPSENNEVLRDENIIVDGVETSHANDRMLSLDLTNLSEKNEGLPGKRKHDELIQVNSCKMLNTDPCNSFDRLVSGSRNSSDLDTSFPVHVLVSGKKAFLANDIGETERGKAQFQDSNSISSKQSALQKQQSEISSKRPSPCSTVQVSAKGRETGLSRSLCMKFPKGVTIPSRAELEKMFGMFGLLDQSKTQIFFYTGVAKVVFSHSVDAQTAYRFASRKKTFLHADMRYWFDDNISHGETSRVQLPSVTTIQCGMNMKSCLKRPNSNKNRIRKRKRQVRFLLDDDLASCATSKQVEPDISEPILQLLVKCDNLVVGVKKSLGLQNYYSIFLLSNSHIQA